MVKDREWEKEVKCWDRRLLVEVGERCKVGESLRRRLCRCVCSVTMLECAGELAAIFGVGESLCMYLVEM